VFFESPNGAFSCIATVAVGQHQLVLRIIGGEEILQIGRYLIVESLEFGLENLDRELLMDVIIGLEPF
jgi:hypothetical protein